MGASGFFRDKFCPLSLMGFGALIGDICNLSFVEDFIVFGGVVYV